MKQNLNQKLNQLHLLLALNKLLMVHVSCVDGI